MQSTHYAGEWAVATAKTSQDKHEVAAECLQRVLSVFYFFNRSKTAKQFIFLRMTYFASKVVFLLPTAIPRNPSICPPPALLNLPSNGPPNLVVSYPAIHSLLLFGPKMQWIHAIILSPTSAVSCHISETVDNVYSSFAKTYIWVLPLCTRNLNLIESF